MGLVLSASGAQSAESSFPGRNGRLAIVQNGDIHSYDVSRPGAPPKRIGSLRMWEGHPRYSPDGERIAYDRSGNADGFPGSIHIARADGTGAYRLRVPGVVGSPSWSPDGSQLAYLSRDGLVVATPDGRNRRRILETPELDSFEWSPNGDRFVVELSPHDQSAIHTIRPDGRGLKRIYSPPSGSQSWSPTWSPDGRRIAFHEVDGCQADRCGGEAWIMVMNADGSAKARLVRGIFPAWSPDGRVLAYEELADNEGVVTMTLSTRAKKTVARVYELMAAPVWQPRCTRRGGRNRDRLRGGAGPDLVCGLGGDDIVTGGRGRDRLFGEDGNDRFFASDGEFDVVGCGAGRDTVVVDRRDLVGRDCERVSRR